MAGKIRDLAEALRRRAWRAMASATASAIVAPVSAAAGLCLAASALAADEAPPPPAGEFTNPILRGAYPDPSIVRVGEDYYLVNSSFEYFPGLPIHHSRDLVNWRLIGYGLHRAEWYEEAVNLKDVPSNGGIHAPSIRWRDGLFYVITTNVYRPPEEGRPTQFVNFIVTAEDPAGPWSPPRIIEGAPGIDPDIFFDDDGKVWYLGTHAPEEPDFPGQGEIWLQELNPADWQLRGERHLLWRGACGGTWAEGPHLYKRDGRYYLLIAEGGTSFNHAVMVAVSDDIQGPYLSNARNPILTSRHLSYRNWVHSIGHADLVELPDGRWYMVALGKRADEAGGSNMGRETHLVPVAWEREPFEWKEVKHEWPVAAPETGRVQRRERLPFPDAPQERGNAFRDDFETDALGLQWNFRRLPLPGMLSLTERPGFLRLYPKPSRIAERGRASLLGFRQQESDFEYRAKMRYRPRQDGVEAGLNLFQKDNNYLSFTLAKRDGQHQLKLALAERDQPLRTVQRQALENYDGEIVLRATSKEGRYLFDYSLNGGQRFQAFAQTDAQRLLSRGYTGAYLGLYGTSNGQRSEDYADFDWVSYQGRERF